MRSPSGWAPGRTRGEAPVATRIASALISSSPALIGSGAGQAAGGLDHLDVLGREPGGDVAGLGPGQVGDPLVQAGRVDGGQPAGGDAETRSPVEHRHRVGRLDEGLGGHAVGEHAGAAEPVGVDDGDVGTELGRDQGGLVTARAAAEDRDSVAWPRSRILILLGSRVGRSQVSGAGYARHPAAGRRTLAPVALYAAYGSNMDPAQMLLRCPHSPQRGTGWLEGWRLTFGGEDIGWDGALATVVEAPGSRVFVVLYDVFETDEKELDNWDGVTLGYYRKAKVRVETLDGDVLAWLYVLNFYEGGLPSARNVGILGRRSREGGRSGRLRRGAARPALRQDRRLQHRARAALDLSLVLGRSRALGLSWRWSGSRAVEWFAGGGVVRGPWARSPALGWGGLEG